MSKIRYDSTRKLSLERKLAAYSAAAGATLLAAVSVNAQTTIYYDVVPDASPYPPISIDLNQDAQPDLLLGFFPTVSAGRAAKAGAFSYSVYLQFVSNTRIPYVNLLGSASCANGTAVYQSVCSSSSATVSCPIGIPSPAAIGSKLGPAPPSGKYIFLLPGGDRFIKLAGLDIVLGAFEAWIRLEVLPGSASAKNDGAPLPPIFVKDHAFFAGRAINCDVTTLLPVELVSFEGRSDDGSVRLSWETASETNNAGFEVQLRASDEETFAPLVFIEGAGTSTETRRYTQSIDNLIPGKHVFRLKQIDLDGAFSYSDVVEVAVEVPGTHFLSDAYPNPFNPQAQFSLVVAQEQSVRVELFDAAGRSVSLLHDGVVAADTPAQFVVEAADLPSGTYLYRVIGENFTESKTLILAK